MALRSANEEVSDALLIDMVLKGLTDEYKPFIAIITQSETVDTFHKFKQALRNFEEMEIIRSSGISKKDSVLKSKEYKKPLTCYNCGVAGHISAESRPKLSKWCNTCKSISHSDQSCRKQNDENKMRKSMELTRQRKLLMIMMMSTHFNICLKSMITTVYIWRPITIVYS